MTPPQRHSFNKQRVGEKPGPLKGPPRVGSISPVDLPEGTPQRLGSEAGPRDESDGTKVSAFKLMSQKVPKLDGENKRVHRLRVLAAMTAESKATKAAIKEAQRKGGVG